MIFQGRNPGPLPPSESAHIPVLYVKAGGDLPSGQGSILTRFMHVYPLIYVVVSLLKVMFNSLLVYILFPLQAL